ncbi:hypothetical protein MKW92_026264 [Papaver armeniacum]|nr:hypothetical protein MKW92_026264 [Papaver armeniacum]
MIDDQKLGKIFVLAYPSFFHYHCIGDFVAKLEAFGLRIKDMRCMHVTEDFARKHLVNINRISDDDDKSRPLGELLNYITSDPVVALITEGNNNSFNKVFKLTSEKGLPVHSSNSKRMSSSHHSQVCMTAAVYASTGQQAELDIKLWFCEDNIDLDRTRGKIIFMLPGEQTYGPLNTVRIGKLLKQHPSYKSKKDLKNVFLMENMCVFVIKPLALHENCVGEILDAIESNSSGLRGLKLVKWEADSGSLSKTDDDEYCVAVVAFCVKPSLKILDGNVKNIRYDEEVFQIGR